MKLTDKNGLRILTADEGLTLFRKGDENNFSTTFYLGIKDSPDNFTEIDEAEAQRRIAEREREREAEQNEDVQPPQSR